MNLTGQTWAPKDTATTVEQRAAALYVTGMAATSTEDATHLLALLGLLPRHHPAVMRADEHGMAGYRLGCKCRVCRKAKSDSDSDRRRTTKGD